MKVLGIVILYYPDNNVKDNIFSYLDAIDALIIWDNTPALPPPPFIDIESPKIIRMGINDNVGIGKALNMAVQYAQDNGFTHLLTMDQDSRFREGDSEKYINFIRTANPQTIFSPNYCCLSNKPLYTTENPFVEGGDAMTSGTIYPVEIFGKIGLFREDFFIDGIDSEFHFRAKRNNIPSAAITAIHLNHNLGIPKRYRFLFFGRITTSDYPPMRMYYIIRNHLIVLHEYPEYYEDWKHIRHRYLYKRLITVIFYEKDKYNKLKAIFMGYVHGKLRRSGRQLFFRER